MTDGPPRCATCGWSDLDPATLKGVCRVNPPVALMGHTKIVAVWPHVTADDWCGAHPDLNVVLAEEP